MVRLLVGDSGGLVKAVHVEEELIAKWGEQSRRAEVQGLCWSGPRGEEGARREMSFSVLHACVLAAWAGHAEGGVESAERLGCAGRASSERGTWHRTPKARV
jgi:hypothetical protein